jgi:hypothetical protein
MGAAASVAEAAARSPFNSFFGNAMPEKIQFIVAGQTYRLRHIDHSERREMMRALVPLYAAVADVPPEDKPDALLRAFAGVKEFDTVAASIMSRVVRKTRMGWRSVRKSDDEFEFDDITAPIGAEIFMNGFRIIAQTLRADLQRV